MRNCLRQANDGKPRVPDAVRRSLRCAAKPGSIPAEIKRPKVRDISGSERHFSSAPASCQHEITPCKAAITARVVSQTIHVVKYPRLPVNSIVVWPSWLPMAHEVQELLLKALANRFRGCFTKQVESAHKTLTCRAEQHRYIDPIRRRAEYQARERCRIVKAIHPTGSVPRMTFCDQKRRLPEGEIAARVYGGSL